MRLRGRQSRKPCLIALWDCFEGRIFIDSCAEREVKLQESAIPGVLSIRPKFPEISGWSQMEWSVSVRSDRNIWDHLWRWSSLTGRSVRPKRAVPFTKILVSSPISLWCNRNFGRNVNGTLRSGWKFTFDEKCRSIFSWLVQVVSDLMVRHNGKHSRSWAS